MTPNEVHRNRHDRSAAIRLSDPFCAGQDTRTCPALFDEATWLSCLVEPACRSPATALTPELAVGPPIDVRPPVIACQVGDDGSCVWALLSDKSSDHSLPLPLQREQKCIKPCQVCAHWVNDPAPLACHVVAVDQVLLARYRPVWRRLLTANKLKMLALLAPFPLSSEKQIAELLQQQVSGGLPQNAPAVSLLAATRCVQRGELWFPRAKLAGALSIILERQERGCTSSPARHAGWSAAAPVTTREAEVAEQLCRGLSNKAIARALGISSDTVKKHLQSLFRKTAARSRSELAARWYANAS